MLKDPVDFAYNIQQLQKELDLNIQLQDEILDSDKMNETFKSIEKNLNILYEKTRYFEEIIEYTKTFLSLKIDEYSNNLNSIINSIEDIKESTKNIGYIKYNVPFIKNVFPIQDRNKNYKIEPCTLKESLINDMKSNLVILNNRVNITYPYNSLIKKCEQVAYDNNLNDLLNNKEYKTIYMEEKPIDNGICEEITIYLNEPTEINEINISTVNSYIKNVRYIYANSIEEPSTNKITGIEPVSRVVTHIKFDLICKNYSTIKYELDKSLASENIFNYMKEIECPKLDIGTSNTKLDTNLLIDKYNKNSSIKYFENINLNSDSNSNEENSSQSEVKVETNSTSKDKTEITVETLLNSIISRTETDINNNVTYKAYRKSPDDVTKLYMYIYNFGIDKLEINRIVQYEDGYFISDPIELGNFNNGEYIQLEVDDCVDSSCNIEYYILDGDIEIPIMPINYNYITNERIFPENDLRFVVDYDIYGDGLKQIKKDGINVNISLDDAKTQYDGRYSADYLPILEYYNYTPLNSSVRIKAIIRTFGNTISSIPYIKNINIRKYGGNSLCTTLY